MRIFCGIRPTTNQNQDRINTLFEKLDNLKIKRKWVLVGPKIKLQNILP